MKYPTSINWNGKDYIAPKGYYFLQIGDQLINGDGYINSEQKILKPYFNSDNMGHVKEYFDGPSVRKIPAPKLQYKLIKDFQIGDLFIPENQVGGIIITGYGHAWQDHKYSISGLNNSLNNYSNSQGISKKDMLEHLNNMKYIFITNINDKIKKTFEAARKLV